MFIEKFAPANKICSGN